MTDWPNFTQEALIIRHATRIAELEAEVKHLKALLITVQDLAVERFKELEDEVKRLKAEVIHWQNLASTTRSP